MRYQRKIERRVTLRPVASLLASLAIAAAVLCAGPARAAGKPEAAFLESKMHMLWMGFQSPTLSRVTANQLYAEHGRDLRAIPGILRYTQSVPLPLYDLRSTFDSVSEFYLEDYAHSKAAFEGPENRVGADPWMIRFSGGAMAPARPWRPHGAGGMIVRDHVIVDGHEQGYKWFGFMRRKEGVTKEAADAYLRERHAPALAKLPGIRRYILGLSYQPAGADGYWKRTPDWDAVDMIWFDSLEDLMRLLASVDYQENVLRSTEAAVIDPSRSVSFATIYTERVPFPPRYEGPRWEEFRPQTGGGHSGP